MKIQLTVDKKWFEANKEKFAKEFDSSDFREPQEKGKGYTFELEAKNDNIIVDDRLRISFQGAPSEHDWTYITVEDELDTPTMLNLAQAASKHYNKIKAAFEALS